MRTSTLIGLAVAFVVLVAAAVWMMGRDDNGAGPSANTTGAPSLASLRTDETSSITIALPGGDDKLTLEKSGGSWKVGKKAAAGQRMDEFFEAVADITPEELASRNPANHERLGVSDDAARKLSWISGGATETMLIGNPGPTVDTFYARDPDADSVYLMNGGLMSFMSTVQADWLPQEKNESKTPAADAPPESP